MCTKLHCVKANLTTYGQSEMVACTPGEVQWLHPALPLELLWDDSLSSSREADQASILQGLFQQALKGPLLPAQQKQILDQLQSYPKRVFSCGLTPQTLPQLVELNPAIAVEVRQVHLQV